MIRIFVLACLLGAAAAQVTYDCTTIGTGSVPFKDFFFVTKRSYSDPSYPPDLYCEFDLPRGSAIMLDIDSFYLRTATLTIREGPDVLFSGSSLPQYRRSMVSRSGYMRITFNSAGDYSGLSGVRMRFRFFDYNRCPPGWVYLQNNCFGTSNVTGDLNYADAQKACNSMSANLLQIPAGYTGSLGTFMRMLPDHLRQFYTFIGLTDRANWNRPYWLNGVFQYSTSELSCLSSGSYFTCYSYERCATFNHKSYLYAVYMDSCSSFRDYACSMPPGGTSLFYRIPNSGSIVDPPIYTYPGNYGVIWGAVVGSLFVLSLIIGGIYAACRSNYVHRSTGATSVVVSTGRVTAGPPTTVYPIQQNIQQPRPPMYPSAQGSLYPAPPPPAYSEVAVGAYGK